MKFLRDMSTSNVDGLSKKIVLAGLLVALSLSCQKKEDVTPTTTPTPTVSCKLTQMVIAPFGSANTYDFAYDASGNVTKYAIMSLQGTDILVLTQTLAYNTAGQLTSGNQSATLNGKAQGGGGYSAYTYTNGLLTGQAFSETASTTPFATATITYDANKRMTKRVYTNSQSKYASTNTYEYDANGNCTHQQFSDSDGYKDDIVSTYDTSKNPQQIVAKGIPFDFGMDNPWQVNLALTVKDTFDDGSGPVVSNGKRTNIKTDAKGYVVGATYTLDGVATNETYTLTNCN